MQPAVGKPETKGGKQQSAGDAPPLRPAPENFADESCCRYRPHAMCQLVVGEVIGFAGYPGNRYFCGGGKGAGAIGGDFHRA